MMKHTDLCTFKVWLGYEIWSDSEFYYLLYPHYADMPDTHEFDEVYHYLKEKGISRGHLARLRVMYRNYKMRQRKIIKIMNKTGIDFSSNEELFDRFFEKGADR